MNLNEELKKICEKEGITVNIVNVDTLGECKSKPLLFQCIATPGVKSTTTDEFISNIEKVKKIEYIMKTNPQLFNNNYRKLHHMPMLRRRTHIYQIVNSYR